MSGEALYERYKDALKRGHVAALRGRVDAALQAYAEAATIAPDRPTPHTSAGTSLLRAGRPEDAVRQFDAALALAPNDEAATHGRAQAFEALGRRGAAATDYDVLAEVRARADRLPEAVDAARRALELAEGRERRRVLRALTGRLRTAELDEPARAALEQALLVLDGPAVAAAGRAGDGHAGGESPGDALAGGAAAGPRGALDRDIPPGTDAETMARAADAAVGAGETSVAIERLLDLATLYRRSGSVDAALEACYRALSLVPDDIDVHLGLVELYQDHGWTELAGAKLALLARLADLDDDAEGAARIVAAAGAGA
jgi:tetratricopeptide (TPR) repeat protein